VLALLELIGGGARYLLGRESRAGGVSKDRYGPSTPTPKPPA
jgi:hypothetical protein